MIENIINKFPEYIYNASKYLMLDNPVRAVLLIVDVLIVAFMFIYLYRIIKKTRAEQIAKGIILFLLLITVSKLLNLVLLNFIFDNFITYGVVMIIIVFQPELRSAFEKIGRSSKLTSVLDIESDISTRQTISEIVKATEILSLKKIGMIVVIERKTLVNDILKDGINIYSRVSSELIQNIFMPRTPLHDGAIVIEKNQILAAKCILPLTTENSYLKGLGTRHRAAIGMSEVSDSIVIVVSEETGIISLAENGKLIRDLTGDDLKTLLLNKLIENNNNPKPFKMVKRKTNSKKE